MTEFDRWIISWSRDGRCFTFPFTNQPWEYVATNTLRWFLVICIVNVCARLFVIIVHPCIITICGEILLDLLVCRIILNAGISFCVAIAFQKLLYCIIWHSFVITTENTDSSSICMKADYGAIRKFFCFLLDNSFSIFRIVPAIRSFITCTSFTFGEPTHGAIALLPCYTMSCIQFLVKLMLLFEKGFPWSICNSRSMLLLGVSQSTSHPIP